MGRLESGAIRLEGVSENRSDPAAWSYEKKGSEQS
jgi:hypothetical protein